MFEEQSRRTENRAPHTIADEIGPNSARDARVDTFQQICKHKLGFVRTRPPPPDHSLVRLLYRDGCPLRRCRSVRVWNASESLQGLYGGPQRLAPCGVVATDRSI